MHAHPTPGAPAFEIADVFRAHGESFRRTQHPSPDQRRVMRDIERCRTPALGGHLYRGATCAAEVGLSNSRLVAVSQDAVTFRTTHGATCTLTPAEFLRRFLLHVLPPRFVKIRHYGLLAAAHIHTRLRRAQELLGPLPEPNGDLTAANTGDDPDLDHAQLPPQRSAPQCPRCGTRTLRIVGQYQLPGYRRRLSRPPPDT